MTYFIGPYEHGDSDEVEQKTPNPCIICGNSRCKSWHDMWTDLVHKIIKRNARHWSESHP